MIRTFTFIALIGSSVLYGQEKDDEVDQAFAKEDSIQLSTIKKSTKTIESVIINHSSRPRKKNNSIIPVEVYTASFLQKANNNNIFDAVGMINGVKPQLNCSVCNTGDIHINGMEGPYTLMLIDGMPMVSALSTVYGLSGIPSSLVDRIEVIKGPADASFGAEAMGGTINIITKNPKNAPKLSLDISSSSQAELNTDLASSFKINSKISSLLSLNHFYYGERIDSNNDHFTDTPLQHRVSVFNKWNFDRKHNRRANLGLRYYYEDRFGGEMNWNKSHRGGNEVYGESIYTNRFEAFGLYDLPTKEKITALFSYNFHDQNSYYGDTSFMANQEIYYSQLEWKKKLNSHFIKSGITTKWTKYNDNTVATASSFAQNHLLNRNINGIFLQDEWQISKSNALLLAYRLDHDSEHQWIQSPRIAYKYSPNPHHTLRASFGKGFRVVHIFTEDHAALTGSREVVINEDLAPEKSYNAYANYITQIPISNSHINLDISGFYSYFTNKIIGDFDTDPTKIIFKNLEGYAVSKGLSANIDFLWTSPLKINLGVTYMDVYQENNGERSQQVHAPKWSGIYNLSYFFQKQWTVDFTGQFYGTMRLPVLENDYRPQYSPFFSLANVQIRKLFKQFEVYAGVKNILNFKPKDPIMRPFDPFDSNINDPINNPHNYTFDTVYGYAPMQGVRTFLGIRYDIKAKKF